MKTKRQYTKEFKEEAVQLAEKLGNKSQVARDLGIHVSLIGRWRQELQKGGKVAFPGNGKPRDEEVDQLKKENRRLQQEVEILKKAVGHRDAVSSVSAPSKIPVYPGAKRAVFRIIVMRSNAGIQKRLLCLAEAP